MKDTVQLTPKVRGVIKKLTFILIFCMTNVLISCKSNKDLVKDKGKYTIKKYKSQSGLTSITLNAYDEIGNKFNPFVEVNDIFFQFKFNKNEIFPIVVSTKPDKKYNIVFHDIKSYDLKIKTTTNKGDSLVINAHLREKPSEPFWHLNKIKKVDDSIK